MSLIGYASLPSTTMSNFSTLPAPKDSDDDFVVENEDVECPCCGGPCYVLGGLGNLTHVRCRNCGIDSSFKAS